MADECVFKKDVIIALVGKGQASKRYKLGETWELNGEEIREAVGDMKPAEVRPVVRGRWEQVMGKYDLLVRCNKCRYIPIDINVNFCPNCGAVMREVQNG